MARQVRIEYEGAFYHITSRGNRREKIFFHEKDRERFLEILRRTKRRYGYLLHAYALMDNHYHILLETPGTNLSKIMQNINTSYTAYVNAKYGKNGHLFQGRFKGIVVNKDEYLVTLSRYIHLNPVRAGIVQLPEESRWTSLPAYLETCNSNGLVDTADTLSLFSQKKKEAVKRYKTFVNDGAGKIEDPFKEVEAGVMLGGGIFKARVMSILESLQGDDELPEARKATATKPLAVVAKTCADFLDTSEEELMRRSRGVKTRKIAIYLAKVISGETSKTVGDIFRIKGVAVGRVIKSVEDQMAGNNEFRRQVEEMKGRVLSVK